MPASKNMPGHHISYESDKCFPVYLYLNLVREVNFDRFIICNHFRARIVPYLVAKSITGF